MGTGSFASDMARAILDSDLLSTRGVEVLIIPYSRALLKRVWGMSREPREGLGGTQGPREQSQYFLPREQVLPREESPSRKPFTFNKHCASSRHFASRRVPPPKSLIVFLFWWFLRANIMIFSEILCFVVNDLFNVLLRIFPWFDLQSGTLARRTCKVQQKSSGP